MQIRVLKDFSVPEKYCNECDQLDRKDGVFGHIRCDLFKCKLRLDGLNVTKCYECKLAGTRTIETGCRFCEDNVLKGYERVYVGNDRRAANPPFCPECGRTLRK